MRLCPSCREKYVGKAKELESARKSLLVNHRYWQGVCSFIKHEIETPNPYQLAAAKSPSIRSPKEEDIVGSVVRAFIGGLAASDKSTKEELVKLDLKIQDILGKSALTHCFLEADGLRKHEPLGHFCDKGRWLSAPFFDAQLHALGGATREVVLEGDIPVDDSVWDSRNILRGTKWCALAKYVVCFQAGEVTVALGWFCKKHTRVEPGMLVRFHTSAFKLPSGVELK